MRKLHRQTVVLFAIVLVVLFFTLHQSQQLPPTEVLQVDTDAEERRVIKSAVLPRTGPGTVLKARHEGKWLRFGRPWSSVSFQSLRIIVHCIPKKNARVLLYSQRLSGVFNPSRRQYVAVWLTDDGHLEGKLLVEGQSAAKHVAHSGYFCDGMPRVITVEISTDMQLHITALPVRGNLTVSQPPKSQLSGFMVDSGIYIGSVQDRKYITAADDLPAIDNMDGVLFREISINGELIDLDSDERVQSGVTNEDIGRYLTQEGHVKLSEPVKGTPKMADIDMQTKGMQYFPVVSAVSDDHVGELTVMISTVQKVMPLRGVIVYNLGLTQKNQARLAAFCNTTVRDYRSEYQHLIAQLYTYRFKPLLIHSALDEFGAVVYADSSIRFTASITGIPMLSHGYGLAMFGPEGTSPLHKFTHDGMLQYFGVTRRDVTNATIAIGGINVWLDGPYASRTVLNQWFECVLDKNCIAPPGATLFGCDFKLGNIEGKYIGCHRYDQSALSVILLKTFHERFGSGTIVQHPNDLQFLSVVRDEKSTSSQAPCLRNQETKKETQLPQR